MNQPPLLLASSSPYRKELLARLGLPFNSASPDIDETPAPGESAEQLALRLATGKARALAEHYPDTIIIGSDQVADLGGRPLGKPGTHERAVAQLRQMRGRTVVFQTAVAVVCQATGFAEVDLAPVRVKFRDLTDGEIETYLRAETPYDCAGSFKMEGLGIALFRSMEGRDPNSLIGLPLIALIDLLRELGVNPLLQP